MRAVIALALLAFVMPAAAGDCEPSLIIPELDTGETPAGRYYVDNDFVFGGASVWVYQESNGIDGLQRQDAVWDDTCGGKLRADTVVGSVYA